MSLATPHDSIFSTGHEPGLGRYLNPARFALDAWARRQLLWQFTLREVQGRYRGSYLGLFWAMITPLFMLAVYTFVFHFVFGARWDPKDPGENFMVYAVNMFTGIVVYGVFSESVVKVPLLIIQNPNYVKKVVFPLEVLPSSQVGSALIHALLGVVVLLIAVVVAAGATGRSFAAALGAIHFTVLWLPLMFVPLVLFSAGVCWFLAALGVFLRDVGNVVAVAVQLLFFVTPITYPTTRLPPIVQPWMHLNPLAGMIENVRRVVNQGYEPNWRAFGVSLAVALVAAVLGYAWFMKLKRAFADVL